MTKDTKMHELEKIESGQFDIVEAIKTLARAVRKLDGAQTLVQPAPTPAEVDAARLLQSALTPDRPRLHIFYVLFGARLAGTLLNVGYRDIEDLRKATDEELLDIDGVGPVTLRQIREVIG